jgi:putative tricarboxylic transport membrane protein
MECSKTRHRLLAAVAVIAGAALIGVSAGPTPAAAFPDKPVKIVVPFGQSGSAASNARFFQKAIEDNKFLAQPIAVVFVPGAGGTIGARQVKDAEPDGHTILLTHIALIGGKAMGNVDFGPEAFEPIAATGRASYLLVVRESLPVQTLDELFAKANAEPETIVAALNLGGANHICAVIIENLVPGAKFRHAQFGGISDSYPALLGGHADLHPLSTSAYKNTGGKGLRALGYMAEERHPLFPDIRTFKEQGYDIEFGQTYYWFAPKGTPQDRVDILADALEKAMATDYIKDAFEKQTVDHVFMRGEAFRKKLAAESDKVMEVAERLRATRK